MTIQEMWEEFRFKHIKPDANPKDVALLKQTFIAGVTAMLGEFAQIIHLGMQDLLKQAEEAQKSEN